MDEIEQKNIGVLIDADNTPCKKLRAILQEIAVHGHIITKRAYGDFYQPFAQGLVKRGKAFFAEKTSHYFVEPATFIILSG